MEDLLLNIVKESGGSKFTFLKQSAQEAHDLLSSQQGPRRTPSHELRSACFRALRLALETKRSKLVSYAVTGLHKIVRDERFQAGSEPEDDSLWLPSQLLHATMSLLSHCEDTQVQILRVILALACSTSWALNGRLVMLLLGRCGEAYEAGTQPIKAASQAAASQTVTAFCTFLDEECQEILQQQNNKTGSVGAGMVFSQTCAVACFNEVIPVMQFISSRLEEAKVSPRSTDLTVFLLECLLTLVSTLPPSVHTNTHFTTFLWQRFCPALLSLLGTPGESNGQCLTTHQAKIVYSIGIQLVRLVGTVATLRPVLEALFHRMLLLPGPVRRLEPLRAIKELLRSPGRLADLLLLAGGSPRPAGDDMAIIRLIMDSIEESSQCNDPAITLASVECVVAMLSSLESLCRGEGIAHEAALTTNIRYASLEQADYKGPLTYQSLTRLPKPYRDMVANLKYQSDSDSSGIDGGANGSGLSPVGDGDTDSECSGATEGPENEDSCSEDSVVDDDSFLTSQELQRLQKVPKILHLGRSGLDECNVDIERHNARRFVKTLQNVLLPNLLTLRSSIQVDEVLQEFASKCCQHNSAQSYEITTIMNADGIYLATYSALLLNLKLIHLGHYDSSKTSEVKVPLTEAQFVEEVHGSGVLVYLSATWLSELYQQVLAISLLEQAGYKPNSTTQQYALVNLLTDVGGLSSSQLLTDWQRLERVQGSTVEQSPEMDAGLRLSRRVLTCCWDSMVTVLSGALGEVPVGLRGRASALGLFLPRRARRLQYKKKVRDSLVSSSLDGLHKAASLSNTLGLQSKSGSILSLLSSSACQSQSSSQLHVAHALSLDVLLSKGLALGSHNSSCWIHVFTACVYVAKLEHTLFSKSGSAQVLMVAQNANSVITTSTTKRLNASFSLSQDEETCIDVYSFLQSPSSSAYNSAQIQSEPTITDIVNKSGAHNTGHGLLSNVDAAKVCCLLSQKVDNLFHEAALKLNLPCLCSFLEELCTSSQKQLFVRPEEAAHEPKKWWKRELEQQNRLPQTLLLHRIGDVTLKCIRAGRPLVHTMRVWSIVGPHFMEAACHKDRSVSKKAITCIHDSVIALLNEHAELPHFHFNEALFKPFENLLCLELCDSDVQDQIVSCLCEFVEGNHIEICSGWRPLFGTLRVASIGSSSATTLEVFKIFLSIDNTLVFANAALDYILCLLTHIRNSDLEDEQPETTTVLRSVDDHKKVDVSTSLSKSGSFLDSPISKTSDKNELIENSTNFAIASLRYLENCTAILTQMYNMPKCPTFNMSHRIQIETEPQLVDPIIQNVDVVNFKREGDSQVSYKVLSVKEDMEMCEKYGITLSQIDKPSGVLKIWYVLLEGLSSATIICARKNQPYALETLFKLMKELIVCPGANFGLYCVNHLLLPMVQNWLRQNSKVQKTWDVTWPNFKHCCGMATELVVEYLFHMQDEESAECQKRENPGLMLALKQLLIVLIECVGQSNENVARLGASCMRHVVLSAGQILNADQWDVVVTAIHRACTVSLNPLYQLTLAFSTNSDSFYGDLATVKVAARKDCTVEDNMRLYQLARQVFLMSFQRDSCETCGKGRSCDCTEHQNHSVDDRSYVFLLYPIEMASALNPDLYTVRVPFRSLVVGILAHQLLIQTVSSMLLQNLNHVTPILSTLQVTTCNLRGILRRINAKHVYMLTKCFELSGLRATEFDLRPGLKFLTQKVGNLNRAANLYTQANTSEIVQIIVLIELCLDGIHKHKLDSETVLKILETDECVESEPLTDSDFIEMFLRNLRLKWDNLCDAHLNLSVNIPESDEESECCKDENNEIAGKTKPFKFSDFARSLSYGSSTDSNGETQKDDKKKEDEVNRNTENEIKEFENPEESEAKTNKETEMKVEAMMEQYRRRKPYYSTTPRLNPFSAQPQMPPPQPVPPEIQQQRAFSIRKDAEVCKNARIETTEACLELLNTLPDNRMFPLASVLAPGTQRLLTAPEEKVSKAAEMLLERLSSNSVITEYHALQN